MFFGTVFKELFKDIDVLDVDVKTETAASSENSGWKSIENEQNKRKRSIVLLEDICTRVFSMMQELDDDCKSRIFNKYCWTWSEIFVQRRQIVCVREQTNLVQRRQFEH